MFFTPNSRITSLPADWIFVFGSNLDGRHAGGAARDAVQYFGAKWGQGEGLQGQSYAIPTMHGDAHAIKPYVDRFIAFAKEHQEYRFVVTPIGCGIAGRPLSDMAGLFKEALKQWNVMLPRAFVLAIYAEEALRFGAEDHFTKDCDTFEFGAFADLERANIICTDHCSIYTIIRNGGKYGLFKYDDPMASYGEDLKLRSVGPAFGYDEVLFYDNRTGYPAGGYHENYDGYVALNENGRWSVLALDADAPLVLMCEGDSFGEVAEKVVNLTGLRHICWIDPLEAKKRHEEESARD